MTGTSENRATTAVATHGPATWSVSTWLGATAVMIIGDVLIGVDQAATGLVMPTLESVFHFGTFGAGWVGGIQMMSFGVVGFVGAGWLSDRLNNRKPVMIPCLAAFGVLSWLTGVVGAYWQLLLVRCVMGAFGGGWLSLMFTRSGESGPSWARTIAGGLSLASVGGGLGLVAPRVVPPLADAVGWRPVFFIVGAPAVLLAIAAIRYLPSGIDSTINPLTKSATPLRLVEAFRYRNIVVSGIVCAFLFGTLSLFIVFGTVYLTHRGFTLATAGDALSGWGIGGVLGAIGLPALSERLGRKWVGVVGCLLGAAAMYWFSMTGSSNTATFAAMIVVGFLVQGSVPLFLVLIASETVQDRLRGKAVGLVDLGTTAIGGGAFAVLIGVVGTSIGLHATFMLGIGACLLAGVLAAIGIVETHPARGRPVRSTTPARHRLRLPQQRGRCPGAPRYGPRRGTRHLSSRRRVRRGGLGGYDRGVAEWRELPTTAGAPVQSQREDRRDRRSRGLSFQRGCRATNVPQPWTGTIRHARATPPRRDERSRSSHVVLSEAPFNAQPPA